MIVQSKCFNNSRLSVKKNTYRKVIYASILTTAMFCESQETFAAHTAKTYYLQTTSYKSYKKAHEELNRLQKKMHLTGLVRKSKVKSITYYQVQFGPYEHLQKAKSTKDQIARFGQVAFIRSYQSTPINQVALNRIETQQVPHSHHSIPKRQPEESKPLLLYKPAPAPTVIKTSSANLYGFPYHLRALGQGTVGQQTSFFDGDAMLPLLGNNEWIGYVDGAAKYGHDEAWYASIGGGFRGIYANSIWGAYVFGDRNVAGTDNNAFWVVNPGIEAMSNTWDAHINGYIPVSSKFKSFSIKSGQKLGMNTMYFSRHSQYDEFFEFGDATGPGIDGEVGRTWPSLYNVRTFIGGYHFDITDGPKINGIEGGVELPVTSYATVLVHDAYDKVQHNTIMGTLRLTFGAIPKSTPLNIHDRMLDPIQRHLGAYQTGAGIPIVKVRKSLGTNLVKDNIWFFNEGGSSFVSGLSFANCTYENPCGVIEQAAIDGINNLAADASFYINTGTYTPPTIASPLYVHNGQSFYGRQNNFMREAQGNNRPIINNSLFVYGNNTFDNIQVNGQFVDTTFGGLIGIEAVIGATGYININNSVITASGSDPAGGILGITTRSNDTTVTINNSEINVTNNSTAGASNTIGINNFANGQMFLNNSVINVTSNNSSTSTNFSFIVDNVFSGSIIINNSILNAVVNNAAGVNGSFNGAVNYGTGLVSINDSSMNASITNGQSGFTELLMLYNYGYGTARMNISNSSISGVMHNVSGVQVIGVLNNGIMNIDNSSIVAQILGGTGSTLHGIDNFNGIMNLTASEVTATASSGHVVTGIENAQTTSDLNYSDSTINANGDTATAMSNNGGAINNEGGNLCFENGASVPCLPTTP